MAVCNRHTSLARRQGSTAHAYALAENAGGLRVRPGACAGASSSVVPSFLALSKNSRYICAMAAPPSAYKDRQFIAVIGDEDSVTGLLLAGIGHVTQPPDSQKNFLVVDSKTDNAAIEEAFERFTTERKDIGILLINQHIAERIRHRVDTYTAAFPALLEIPSKDHPYDPEKDSVLRRVRRLFGE